MEPGQSLGQRTRGPVDTGWSAARATPSVVPPARAGDAAGRRIRDWPRADRPRERLLNAGPRALGDAELVAILLGTGHGGQTALDLGRRVLALGGGQGAAGLLRLVADDLAGIAGIGPAKAAVLLAAVELARRAAVPAPDTRPVFRRPDDVAEGLMLDMASLDREQFRVLLLDTRHALISSEVIALGGLDHVPAEAREVFKPAIRRSAAAIIAVHNHPSGDPEPSPRDLALTDRLVRAGRLLGVPLLDHLVVGRGRYVSLAARGVVPRPEP